MRKLSFNSSFQDTRQAYPHIDPRCLRLSIPHFSIPGPQTIPQLGLPRAFNSSFQDTTPLTKYPGSCMTFNSSFQDTVSMLPGVGREKATFNSSFQDTSLQAPRGTHDLPRFQFLILGYITALMQLGLNIPDFQFLILGYPDHEDAQKRGANKLSIPHFRILEEGLRRGAVVRYTFNSSFQDTQVSENE